MKQPSFKGAITICKSIMRNGFDAHIVSASLQHDLIEATGDLEIDLATDAPPEELAKIFPALQSGDHSGVMACLEEDGILYRFYRMIIAEAASPQVSLTRLTPTMLKRMAKVGPLPRSLVSAMSSLAPPPTAGENQGFCEIKDRI